MPKYDTITVEDCFILSLKSLREAGYLILGKTNTGIIAFTPYGGKKAQFEILVSMLEDPFLQLSYQTYDHFTGERNSITYQVSIEAFPANIGGGERYYFRCPNTGLRCLKLYCPPGEKYFFHRLAFPYLIYHKQTESKAYRAIANSAWAKLLQLDQMEEELYLNPRKYAKRYYKGKPTKWYGRYLEFIDSFAY